MNQEEKKCSNCGQYKLRDIRKTAFIGLGGFCLVSSAILAVTGSIEQVIGMVDTSNLAFLLAKILPFVGIILIVIGIRIKGPLTCGNCGFVKSAA